MMSIIAGLKTNRVDTVTLWDPGTTIALNENTGYSVIDLVDPAQHRQIMHSDQSMVEVIAAREDMISAQRDKLRKFFAALNEANTWIHGASVEEVAQVVGPLVGEVEHGDPGAVAQAQRCLAFPRSRPSTRRSSTPR